MTDYALPMLQIVVTWAVLLFLVTGLGSLVSVWTRHSVGSWEGAFLLFWLGYAAAILILQLWHFFLPVGPLSDLVLGTLAGVGFVLRRANWRQLFRGRARRLLLLAIALFVVWIAHHATGRANFDTGLYHLAAVRWCSEYPIVPGLGNLHGRLAFNSSHFLFMAATNVGFWEGRTHHIIAGLLSLVIVSQCLYSVDKFARRGGGAHSGDLFLACALPLLVRYARGEMTSSSPAVSVMYLGVVLTYLLFALWSKQAAGKDEGRCIGLLVVLGALGVALKISFAVFGGMTVLVAAGILFLRRRERSDGYSLLPELRIPVVLGLLIVLPWLARNVVLSGCLIYPSTWITFDVPWAMPEAQVIDEANWIKSWARQPGVDWHQVLANWSWLGPWLERMRSEKSGLVFPMAVMTISLVVLFIRMALSGRGVRASSASGLSMLFPAAGGLLFWFVTAPDPRFAGAIFLALGMGSLVVLVQSLGERARVVVVRALVLVSFLATAHYVAGHALDRKPHVGFYPVPVPEVRDFRTDSGLLLKVPKERDQVWNTELPNTPYPNQELRLRQPGDLGAGFTVR